MPAAYDDSQRTKTTIADIPPAAEPEPLALPHEPTGEQEEDDVMQGSQWTRKKHLERRAQAEARNAQRHKKMCP